MTMTMTDGPKKILIIDEHRFSRICSAILETVGYATDIICDALDLPSKLKNDKLVLIVTSYPYGISLFDEIKQRRIPTIILSDNLDEHLINTLKNFDNSYCMIKPLDYDQFKSLVQMVINGQEPAQGGYRLV